MAVDFTVASADKRLQRFLVQQEYREQRACGDGDDDHIGMRRETEVIGSVQGRLEIHKRSHGYRDDCVNGGFQLFGDRHRVRADRVLRVARGWGRIRGCAERACSPEPHIHTTQLWACRACTWDTTMSIFQGFEYRTPFLYK